MADNLDKFNSFKKAVRDQGLEQSFLTAYGLDSFDDLDPKNFNLSNTSTPPVVMQPVASAAPVTQKKTTKKDADAATGFEPNVASDMLRPYIGLHINYASRKKLSSYAPSCLMMDYVLHNVNSFLADNFYFKRSVPDFHPYILRLYYGILFWIQCLRAMHDVRDLNFDEHQFLLRFLDAYPPESLTVSGPLLPIFKTLCSSQPEIPTYGKVYPRLPRPAGPPRRDAFMRQEKENFLVPNIPGIFALLEDLNAQINPTAPQAQPVFPAKGKHIPVAANAAQARVFGHHSFPASANRTEHDSWSLCSPGLLYPCEADKKINETFAERYENFDFPPTAAADSLQSVEDFLGMSGSLAWFSQVKDVAAMESLYFKGSGTLADCPPTGISANQIIVGYTSPDTLPTTPASSCDIRSSFPFSLYLNTSARSLPELSEAMAALAQTNIHVFDSHPYLPDAGMEQRTGEFWEIRPDESSVIDDTSYLDVRNIIRGLMKTKI